MIPEKEDLENIILALKNNSSYDLSNYSLNSLGRRFGKILDDLKLSPSQLIEKINGSNSLPDELIKRITVNTTELFRDPKVWVELRKNVLPLYRGKSPIKIWHPGCSTGQEVYSLMILLDKLKMLDQSQVYASDINENVIETSKTGKYNYRFNKDFHSNFLKSFEIDKNLEDDNFDKYLKLDTLQEKIQMANFLVQKPEYKKMDLVKDENLFNEKFDVIMCRNVIIYFNYDLQNQILEFFHKNMSANSCLILGIHESIIGPISSKFEKKNGVYFKC